MIDDLEVADRLGLVLIVLFLKRLDAPFVAASLFR
jgi:hypothetical protein